ncbi:hypothetical protein WR25_22822 [Diploscapter pachys]|uniref:Uncharacterized protein n=1 Tax=Diploscapter pachys TaxID=2018661 RepID=A0A2A2KC47_9BILA|nr:hypothetical protein WR25_22822 [Diploscapter pachys]
MTSEVAPQPSTSSGITVESNTTQGNQKGPPAIVTPAHHRVHFLYNAAVGVSMQGNLPNDGFAKLSRKYSKLLRGVLNVERPKIAHEISRTFCKKCREVLTAKIPKVECRMIQKKVLQRKCLTCGNTTNFQITPNYISKKQQIANKS